MRKRNKCPTCGGSFGRVETAIRDGHMVKIYWHTDLEDHKEFCIEQPDGTMKQVCQGGMPTGPRKA